MADIDIETCDKCGVREHIDLLDAKPNDPNNPEGCDWERLECIACYGPGWDCNDAGCIAKSVAPTLKVHYQRYLARETA